MAEDIKLVIGTDNPTIVVTTVDKVNIRDAAKSSEINFVATGSSGIKGDTGPQGPAGTGITTEQAAAIDTNTAKNSFDSASINKLNNIEANAQVNRALLDEDNMASDSDTLAPTQQSVKAYVDGQTHLQIGTNSINALAGNTTTITTSQSSAITANTNKTGITTSQASAIVTNTAKTGITTSQASAITANTAKTGITTSQANAITANTAKPDLTVDGAGTVHSNNYTDTVYTHPSSHPISLITGLQTALNAKQDSIGNEDLTIQQTDGLQDALNAKVDDSQVLSNHAISVITGLQTALDSKQDGIGSEDLTIAMTDGLQVALDAKVDDSQVLTNVPANAVFTDTNTTYSVQDGELSQNNFTDADHTKLNGIEASATADQTKADIDALGIAATTAVSLTAGNKTINGNLIITGTVDGIDIATDVAANTAKTSFPGFGTSSSTALAGNTTIPTQYTDALAVHAIENTALTLDNDLNVDSAFIYIHDQDGTAKSRIGTEALTANQTVYLPDSSGTIALTNKTLQQFNLSFIDDISNLQHYLSWRDQYETSTNNYTDIIDTNYLVPANGRVKCVYIRVGSRTSTRTMTVKVYSQNAGFQQSQVEQEAEATSINSSDDFEVFAFYFDNTEHFQAGDSIKISVQDSEDSGGTQTYHVTAVLEFDYTQMGRTTSGELA
jgi:hypothetical protein